MSHFILPKKEQNYMSLHVSVSILWSNIMLWETDGNNQPNSGRYYLFPGYFVLLKFSPIRQWKFYKLQHAVNPFSFFGGS
jgi:hypothetical protein